MNKTTLCALALLMAGCASPPPPEPPTPRSMPPGWIDKGCPLDNDDLLWFTNRLTTNGAPVTGMLEVLDRIGCYFAGEETDG